MTDICWWFVLPLLGRYMNVVLMLFGIVAISALTGVPQETVGPGAGPLSALPFWGQVAAYFILGDLMLYWSHRAFHHASLWKYHAVHHSPEELDWISARRFHPLDQLLHSAAPFAVLLLLGISPEVIIFVSAFDAWYSALVHVNIKWDFGPFCWVLASPVYHRWHHTDVARGGSKNFAATFPIFDLMFGTYYMPRGVLPDGYGVDDPDFPKTFGAQLLYPFRSKAPEVESSREVAAVAK
jgi:sterol desaturase/sphingolipid hydroxylase (fatty acid hydroxylase superfamily)